MTLRFTKMNGAGNDFVMLDNRDLKLRLTREQIERLCDRHRGVGADGLLLAEPCANGKADFRMHYFNADGGEAEMCGNGARCFARFVQKLGWQKSAVAFETLAGIIHAEYQGELVRLGMSAPHGLRLHDKVKTSHGELAVSSINTGVPHAIVFVEDADKAMVGPLGRELRFHDHFKPKGTNVNFVQPLDAQRSASAPTSAASKARRSPAAPAFAPARSSRTSSISRTRLSRSGCRAATRWRWISS